MAWTPTEEDIDRIEQLAGRGLSVEQIADYFGISKSNLHRSKDKIPDIQEAWERGRARAFAFVTSKLMDNISIGKEASIFFYLKTQYGWRETSRHELTGKDGDPIETSNVAPDSVKKQVAEFMSALKEGAEKPGMEANNDKVPGEPDV